MASVPAMHAKPQHVMGPLNPRTQMSQSKELQYGLRPDPDEEPVYEVSSISMSSYDLEELKTLQIGFITEGDENLYFNPKEVKELQKRYFVLIQNWRHCTTREALAKKIKEPQIVIENDYKPRINPNTDALLRDDRVKIWDRALRRRATSFSLVRSSLSATSEQGNNSKIFEQKRGSKEQLANPTDWNQLNNNNTQTKTQQNITIRARSSSISFKAQDKLVPSRIQNAYDYGTRKLQQKRDIPRQDVEFEL